MRKSWHEDFPQRERDDYVRLLARAMSTGDPAEDIKKLVTDAQSTERDIFKSANSRAEYSYLMNKKMPALRQKRRKRREMKQSGQMKSMDQTSTPPLPPDDKVISHVGSGTQLKDEQVSNVKQKGGLTSSFSTAEGVKLTDMEDTPPEKKGLDEERYINVSLRGRGKHTIKVKNCEMEDTPEETKQLDEERVKSEDGSEWTMFGPPFTSRDSPRIQSQSQPQISPLEPCKHHSMTETPSLSPSTSSDSTLSRPHMVSSQRTQDRKRGTEELEESNHPSSTLPLLPSSTLSTSLHMSSLSSAQVPPLPRKRREASEMEESDIPSSQDVPPEVMLGVPNMYPVATISPMLSFSFTSQQSFQHSQEEIMSCDTHLSTTDRSVTESLSSVHHSLELQDETDLSSCFSGCKMEESITLPSSHSLPSLNQIPSVENKGSFRAKRSHSLNDVTLLGKTQNITPDIIVVENEESYRFHSTQGGLFQCNVTNLVFKMKAEGDVTYRTVPWHRRLLSQLGKRPAGPLFDINASQRSVCRLHFPHCEILSTGGGKYLSVVHVKDDNSIELIKPLVITETHVIIDVHGFSPYGVITDVDSPNPIQAYVLLFYTPPIDDDDPISTLNVLLLPGNVVLEEVMTKRNKIHGEEIYIVKPPCKLIPKKEYTLSTSPQDDIKIEPNKAKFEVEESSYHNYESTFEVTLGRKFKRVALFLKDSNTSVSEWESSVNFSDPAIRRQQVKHTLSLSAEDRLFKVRSEFIDSISGPNLNSVVEKLLQTRVLNDTEMETATEMQNRNDKARFVIDTVTCKGPDASSSMIGILCCIDPFLCKSLELMTGKGPRSVGTLGLRQSTLATHSKSVPFPSTSQFQFPSISSSEVSILPRKRRKKAETEQSDIPFQDVPQEVMTPSMYPVATVSSMLSSSSTSQQSSHDSPDEMLLSDTDCDWSTADHAVTEPLSSVHHSLELQDETDVSSCFSGCKMGESISLPRSHSLPSLIPGLENKTGFREKRSHSLNDLTLLEKTQKFTPDIIVVENQESYRFNSTQAGLFQCSVTNLVFKMKAEGDVTYRTVPWQRGLLSQLGKRPAGPLFDINASQKAVSQLRFPHCEILSMGGGKSLSVVHVMDDDSFELIYPDVITETHVIINVNGFSVYGISNDVDSPNPVQAFVSLFYKPPIDDDDEPSSILTVLLLPENVVLSEVLRTRRKINGEEIYIEMPQCELMLNHEYTLSTSTQNDAIIILPNKARFKVNESSYKNYNATFVINLEERFKNVRLLLRDSNTSICAWEGYVKLTTAALRKQQVQRTLTLSEEERLSSVRSSFIDRVSLPNINCLVDKLLSKKVLNDAEREMADEKQMRNDKARFVIDTVRNKGPEASSAMIVILCDLDTLLSEHLGLM